MNNQGCSFLQYGINFDLYMVCDCCISHNDGRGLPILISNYKGNIIDWESLFDKKAKRIQKQKQKTIFECEGCYHLNNFQFTNERKISEFHFSHFRICNAKCIYCSSDYNSKKTSYNTYPVIKDLIEKGYYKSGGEATFQGGEPTLMPNFDELVDLFIEQGTIVRIHSNGIKYSDTVSKALKLNKGTIVISLDSATNKTYKKIKRVDSFETVCSNIKKYVDSSSTPDNVIIKYIIIPGVNDNINEIDKFFILMNKLNVKKIALDIEVLYARAHQNKFISPHIYLLVDYFEKLIKKYNKDLLIYSFLSYILKNRNIKQTFLIKYKPLFKIYLSLCNQRNKNLIYLGK